MELLLDGALTVADLKKVLDKLPDDAVIGTSVFDIVCHVEKATRVLYSKEHKIVTFDNDKHAGAFSDEEFESESFETLADGSGNLL